jgi:murein L,D-transpeptidase YcbB/YkuD
MALMACMAAIGAAGSARAQSPVQYWHQQWEQHQQRAAAPAYSGGGGWFGGDVYGYAEQEDRGHDSNWSDDDQGDRRSRPMGPMPQVHVSNPTFYEYRPDALKSVTFAKLCQVEVASNTPPAPIAAANPDAAGQPAANGTPSAAPAAQSPFTQACAASPAISMRVLPQVGDTLTAWYSAHPEFVWVEDGKVSGKALAAMAALAASDKVGLNPADYRVDVPNLDNVDGAARQTALLRFELRLSSKALTYVLDATRGRIDPDRLSGYHDLPRKTVDLGKAMNAMSQQGDVAAWLDARNPSNPQFRALVAELGRLKAASNKPQVHLSADLRIVPGDVSLHLGDVLTAIGQAAPAVKQDFPNVFSNTDIDEYKGDAVAAVKAFQKAKGLSPDGMIGRNTIRALTARDDNAGKIAKIEMALERLRWLPADFGKRYVFLNQPAFEVSYVDGNNKPLTMRAVVGRPDAQTYFFTDHIKDVEYNPYWNVPRSIVVNEMLPKLYRDGSYLDEHGYQVLNQRGRQVASNSVNWAAFARNAQSVDVRQPPGRRNALGLVKIEFPNKHAIYMHDTNEKAFFTRDMRALSHGCVRLQHPKEMAAAVLGKDVDYVEKKIARGDNATERAPGDIPVYLAYFTAWPDQSGTVRYYNDIYTRDAHLKTALEKTEAARKNG